ncbi:MAG: hypothetical protein RLZZ352_2734 [Pseudomonadota bacterium]|jgi:general secretion pathway protein A
MYLGFFGLQRAPFSIAPDPRFLYMSQRHREALAHLVYGLQGGGGVVVLTGEIGAGKTTVVRHFLDELPAHCQLAFIFNPRLTTLELLQSIGQEFGVTLPPGAASVQDHLAPLNDYLLQCHAAGLQNLLVIDEAQNLSAAVLEQLRLLTNLETPERKLLQIILIGQPELRDMLARPDLEQLAQRVVARCHLGALSPTETQHYIAHRLQVAGWQGVLPFPDALLPDIHALSRGVPRRINLLCDRALLGAYALGQQQVDRTMLRQAAAEVFPTPPATAPVHQTTPAAPPTGHGMKPGLATGLGVGLLAGAALGLVAGVAAVAGALGLWGPALDAWRNTPVAPPSVQQPAPATPTSPPTTPATPPASQTAVADAAAPARAEPDPSPWGQPPASALWRNETAALRTLSTQWGMSSNSEPCTEALRQGLQCFRTNRMTLHGLRQLDRPAALLLRSPASSGWAVLSAMDAETATLSTADGRWRMPLTVLAGQWRGDYTTLWRTPPGQQGHLTRGDSGPAADWLAQTLLSLQTRGALDARATDSTQRLRAFQHSQGLEPDAPAGPLTFMLLNRASEVAEPRLSSPNSPSNSPNPSVVPSFAPTRP